MSNKNVLANVAGMHNCVFKYVTVKQVTLNVTDMDRINIVSSQAVLQMSFSMDTRWKCSSPLVNSLVKNRLLKTAPDIDELPFQLIHTMDLSVVDTTLHNSSDLVIHRTEIWAVYATLHGAVTWRNQCHDRATLQGVRIPSAILKIVFRHILFYYRATRLHSAYYAAARCLSTRLSVRHTPVLSVRYPQPPINTTPNSIPTPPTSLFYSVREPKSLNSIVTYRNAR